MNITTYCFAPLAVGPVKKMLPNHLGQQLFKGDFTRQDVLYDNTKATLATATQAADKAYDIARKAKGPIVLCGHSHGARALALLLRRYPDLDPEKVVFVLTGNPERKYGGMFTIPGAPIKSSFSVTPGIPADTAFRVWDVSRQYEFFADYPDKLPNSKAVSNALAGSGLHLDYSGVRIGDPNNVVHVEGTVSYVMQPTFPMPSCQKLFWSADREGREDAKIRAQIEAAYTRPTTLKPKPQKVKRYPNGAGYDVVTRRTVAPLATPAWNPFR